MDYVSQTLHINVLEVLSPAELYVFTHCSPKQLQFREINGRHTNNTGGKVTELIQEGVVPGIMWST